MAKKKPRTRRLTVLLIRENIKQFDKALKDPDSVKKYDLSNKTPWGGALYVAESRQRQPSWRGFLEPVITKKISGLYNAATSAVLFVRAKGRIFAFTFGYGRNLLAESAFELGFGLRTALNVIDHEQIRSMDVRVYEDMVLSTRKQTSRSSELGSFGLDVARDLVRAVTGEPKDNSFATRVSGTDSLTLNVPITAGGLGKKCEAIFEAYCDDAYKQNFDWIDHLDEVREKDKLQDLDETLVDNLKARKTSKMHLAPSDTVDWQEVDVFRIGGAGRKDFGDLDIDEYLEALGDNIDKLSPEALRSRSVRVRWSGSENFAEKWSLYRCIVWEVAIDDELYALVDGKWFRIDKNFARRVKTYVRKLPEPIKPLPDSKANESEDAYNERVAKSDSALFLLDKKLVKPIDAATRIEFCDLLSKQRQLFHVKRKTRSATLSHLFSQGTISAQSFLQDSEVRRQVRDYIDADGSKKGFKSLIPSSRPSPGDYEIVYAVVAKPDTKWPGSLPFFSQLNLMQNAKLLRGLGYGVAIQLVEEQQDQGNDDEGDE